MTPALPPTSRQEPALPRMHVVTDDAVLADAGFVAHALDLLRRGGPRLALHLRGHATDAASLFERATRLRSAADESGARLFVNDRVDVALAAGAHGVQLGRRSLPAAHVRRLLPDRWIGYSAHAAEEAAAAASDGTDLVVVGTIYATASHPDATASGPALIEAAAALTDRPVVAIGGVTPGRVAELTLAGAWGVAALRGVWHASQPLAALDAFMAALAAAHGTNE